MRWTLRQVGWLVGWSVALCTELVGGLPLLASLARCHSLSLANNAATVPHPYRAGNFMYDYRMELQMWASCRGQLLARTVSGMMRNEKVCLLFPLQSICVSAASLTS